MERILTTPDFEIRADRFMDLVQTIVEEPPYKGIISLYIRNHERHLLDSIDRLKNFLRGNKPEGVDQLFNEIGDEADKRSADECTIIVFATADEDRLLLTRFSRDVYAFADECHGTPLPHPFQSFSEEEIEDIRYLEDPDDFSGLGEYIFDKYFLFK